MQLTKIPYVSHGPKEVGNNYPNYEYFTPKKQDEKSNVLEDVEECVVFATKFMYKEAKQYYRNYPEHIWLHTVILLWTIILFSILL